MGSFDIFYDAAAKSSVDYQKSGASTSGAVQLLPEGSEFTLAAPSTLPFVVGQRVTILSPAFDIAVCHVTKITDPTHLTLRPIQSAVDNVTLPFTFASGSGIAITDEVAAECVVDLSEAPDDAYNYILVAAGSIISNSAVADIEAYLRANSLQDDPYSGIGEIGRCRVRLDPANPDRVNFVAATNLSLVGGQRYEHSLGFQTTTGNGSISIGNPRIQAFRYTDGFVAGDGKTEEQTSTDTINFAIHLSLGTNALPAGQYLLVATWVAGNSNAAQRVSARVSDSLGTVWADQVAKPATASDFMPAGFLGIVTVGATNNVSIFFRAEGGGTAKIKNAFLAAIPLANIPGFAAAQVSQDLTTNVSQVVTDNSFVTMKTSDPVTLESGRHIEIVSASVGGSAPFRSRPNYGGAGTGLGSHNVAFGTNAQDYNPTFWFIRNRRDAGQTTNALEMRRNTAVSTTLRARDFTFSWLREQPDFRPLPNEPVAVVADIEMGGRVLKSWNSTTTVRRYSHRISEYDVMSRVRVNASEYTRVYSLAALVDGAWFWDAAGHDLYVQLTVADAAIGDPGSDDLHIVVVPLLLVGGQKHDLVDALGVRWPYRPLIKSVPGMTQTLRSSNAKFSTGSSLGQLQLAMAHGEFDDKLFRSTFPSYRAKVRRGFPRKSKMLADFESIADAIIERPESNFETLTLRLLDRRRLLQTPVANTRVTVREGFGGDSRIRENQELPVVWGETLGLVAYRITALEGAADWNEYQFCDHAVASVTNVWVDTERRTAVAGENKDVTATYIGVGKVRVNNAAFDEPTQPPDVVYVDLGAGRTSDGTVSGDELHTLGEIARDLVVTIGGTPPTRLIEKTFRMIDRRWRWQQINPASGGGRRPVPPRISLVISGKTSVEQALTQLCGDTFAFWFVNHQDRIGLDVPDFDRGNLARNHGFEDDSTSAFPWKASNDATLALTTARKYEGARSAEISNGSTPNADAAVSQNILLAAGGTHVVTLVASLLDGAPDKFRIGMSGPSGIETLSEPMTLGTGRWSRHSLVYESEPGDAGFTELRLYPAHGSTVATRIAVDNVEVYRVAAVTDQVRSIPRAIEFESEHYYECTVPYAVNLQDVERASKRNVGESEARGLSAAIEPEGKFAIQSSTRAELNDTRAADGDSAGGIAAPVPLQYSRQRPVVAIDVYGLDRLPVVGDYVMHRLNPRIPEQADEYPIWRIAEVGYDDRDVTRIALKIRQRIDPIIDRIDISPDDIPMGAIAITRSASAITDFSEVTALQNQFALAHDTPDTATQRGGYYHQHPLTHFHVLPSHQHNVTPSSPSGAIESWAGYPDRYDGYPYPGPFGPQAGVNVSDDDHLHTVPTSPLAVAAATGTSGAPTSTIETTPGPIEPSYRRVRYMQRTAAALATIPQDLIVGIRSTTIPAGWVRVTALDGYFIRGATGNGAVSTTLASFTPNLLIVASAANITVGKRLRVRHIDDADKQVHVVVIAIAGTSLTVVPLHETTDEVDTYSFPAGSTVVGDSEAVDTTFTAPTHKHAGLMPAHQHLIGCPGHATGVAGIITGFDSIPLLVLQKFLSAGYLGSASTLHAHRAEFPLAADSTASGSAGGSLTDDVAPVPPYYELIFIQPVDGNQTVLPAGAILFWTQSNTPPAGYEIVGQAKGLLVKGCPDGAVPGSGAGGHQHTQTNDAHTAAHNHGGTVTARAEWPGQNFDEPLGDYPVGDPTAAAAADDFQDLWHTHDITASVSSTDPGLTGNAQTTPAPDTLLPLHKQIVLIEKL